MSATPTVPLFMWNVMLIDVPKFDANRCIDSFLIQKSNLYAK